MCEGSMPAWCEALRLRLEEMARALPDKFTFGPDFTRVHLPEDHGLLPGAPATEAIQRAIDAAAEEGGVVRLTRGDYVSGTLTLRSHVYLEVCAGARLLASTALADYPEHHARRLTVQDTSMGMHQSLIWAEGCEDTGLIGAGVIDGRGAAFSGEETATATPGRPFLIRMIDCRRVLVSGLTLRDAACWMQNYLNCEALLLDGVTVRNHANYNNDGMDIDGCRDVWIRHCRVSSGDDALCFKGAGQAELARVLVEDCDFYSACNAVKVGTDTQGDFRQVLIRRCRIGGLAEDPSGLKHPCADSGISLEMLDGGCLEDFCLEDIHMTRAWSPFFLRLGDRGRVKPGDARPGPGVLRRVLFSRIRGEDNGPRGSYMMGIPEQPIRQIAFEDILLRQYPCLTPPPPEEAYPDFRSCYPDAHMIDWVGPAPAFGLWTRDTEELTLRDYRVIPGPGEVREAFLLQEA